MTGLLFEKRLFFFFFFAWAGLELWFSYPSLSSTWDSGVSQLAFNMIFNKTEIKII
jgi:hypothetical protein